MGGLGGIKASFLHSNFCHFEMRCGAPIEKSPLPLPLQDFSHPFEMTPIVLCRFDSTQRLATGY